MNRFLAVTAAAAVAGIFTTYAFAGESVRGYNRSRGDGTVTNNYSFKGNVNPYTGKVGANSYRHGKTSPYYVGPTSGHNNSH
jgi:hypothetical protein